MYEEAAACEDKDVEEVKSAHLTASFLPKLKSEELCKERRLETNFEDEFISRAKH